MTNACSSSDSMSNSSPMTSREGAIMVEETGEMKVKHDTSSVAAHFLPLVQLRGFIGS